MVNSNPSEAINEEAARWAARALLGDWSPETTSAFEAWMAKDRRHGGAYVRARAALYALEDAAAPVSSSTEPGGIAPDRRPRKTVVQRPNGRGWKLGGALAASVAAAAGLGALALHRPSPSPRPLATAPQTLALADGSTAMLQPGAKLDFTVRDGVRKVVLLRGGAVFHVAKDRAHPFVVQSGDVYAQATGTIYAVRRVGETGGAVRVDEGSVLVWGGDDREQAVLLRAGGALTLNPSPKPAPAPARASARPKAPPPEVAQIALNDVTIAAAAERFNRVNRTRIVVAPAVGRVRIVGLFRANDPERFAQAAAAVAGAEVQVSGDRIDIK
ncbi:FecR family protein [uncultured Caulobacter sp.]|uniref:FecR family protein n=1 Tax=uncultured Caulobacter sp. TaxID=158749 RepID=UPI0026342127|nr:FecR domain-containing protein [uncultured Caulobacter sp.]